MKINKLYGVNLLNDTPSMLPTVLCSTCNLVICETYSKYFNNTDESKNIATLPSDIITQLPGPHKWYDECTQSVAIQCNQDNCCRMCILGLSLNTPSLAINILGKRSKGRPKELSPNREICWRCGSTFASTISKTLHKCRRRNNKLRIRCVKKLSK